MAVVRKFLDIDMDVLNAGVRVVFEPDRQKALEFIQGDRKRADCSEAKQALANGALGFVFRADTYQPLLWMPRKPKTPEEYATLAHEATHAAVGIMHSLRIPVKLLETEELLAHIVSKIVKECLAK